MKHLLVISLVLSSNVKFPGSSSQMGLNMQQQPSPLLSTSATPPHQQTPSQALASSPKPAATPPVDPFASLVSGNSRTSSPFNQLQSSQTSTPPSSSLLDLGQLSQSTAPPPPPAASSTTAKPSSTDDEWTFSSALPEDTLPSSNHIEVLSSAIRIEFTVKRTPGDKRIHLLALFSNTTNQPISELHFQVAIEKVCTA